MALPSTYQLRHSLPNRSPSARPRSLSLSEYQPLAFDRDASSAAYQQTLQNPTSSSTSWASNLSIPSFFSESGSSDTHETATTALSQAAQVAKPTEPPPAPAGGFAGIGAGHSLTPPGSPFHRPGQDMQQHRLRQVWSPGPPLPPRPDQLPESTFAPGVAGPSGQGTGASPRIGMRRQASAMDVDEFGVDVPTGSAEGFDAMGRERAMQRRRELPSVPTNVPVPDPPAWEPSSFDLIYLSLVHLSSSHLPTSSSRPDYKSHIPPELTAPSAQFAYASLGAPPPNLPPRRNPPRLATRRSRSLPRNANLGHTQSFRARQADGDVTMTESQAGPSRPRRIPPPPEPLPQSSTSTTDSASTVRPEAPAPLSPLPPGAPDYPPSPQVQSVLARPPPTGFRAKAESHAELRADGKTPIWSTHYLDPFLKEALFHVHPQVSNVANMALSGLASAPKSRFNTTIGAPIDGLAKLAKDWVIPADGKFVSEAGAIELGLGVVDCGSEGWGKEKGRKKARVEVQSKSGGVKIDLIVVDDDRQIDLRIETKSGDVLVLLPESFFGVVNFTCPGIPPKICDILQPQCAKIANPYESFFTTTVAPLATTVPGQGDGPIVSSPIDMGPGSSVDRSGNQKGKGKSRSNQTFEHSTASHIERFIPQSFREQNDMIDEVVGGFSAHTRGEMSKITIKSSKGRVAIGYRETRDEKQAETLGLKVGVQGPMAKKKKRWWQ